MMIWSHFAPKLSFKMDFIHVIEASNILATRLIWPTITITVRILTQYRPIWEGEGDEEEDLPEPHYLQAGWVWWHLQELGRAMRSCVSIKPSTPLSTGTVSKKHIQNLNCHHVHIWQAAGHAQNDIQNSSSVPVADSSVAWVGRGSMFLEAEGWRREGAGPREGSGCCSPPVRLPWWCWIRGWRGGGGCRRVGADWTWRGQARQRGAASGHYTPDSTLWGKDNHHHHHHHHHHYHHHHHHHHHHDSYWGYYWSQHSLHILSLENTNIISLISMAHIELRSEFSEFNYNCNLLLLWTVGFLSSTRRAQYRKDVGRRDQTKPEL